MLKSAKQLILSSPSVKLVLILIKKPLRTTIKRNFVKFSGRSSTMDVYISTNNANTVSREHSLIEFKNGKMYISNLSKTNPTFLNNDKVCEHQKSCMRIFMSLFLLHSTGYSTDRS